MYFFVVSSTGSVIYSEVRMFLQKQPFVLGSYLSIETSSNESLRMSGNHLVYARESSIDEFNPM